MSHSPESLTPALNDLLSHVGWLRGLAFTLVRDPDAADDLSQEVLRRALDRAPRDGRPLRPWLGTVLRNAWRERHRTNARRTDREQRRDQAHASAPTDELVAKVELERKLAALVLDLAEPYRTTLLLRFWEGLEPAAIARRLDEPAGTVRWRLKHGLDQLRARLDARHEGRREEWIAALAPLWRREAAATAGAGSFFLGALTMSSVLKISVLALAGILAFWLPFAGGSESAQGTGEAPNAVESAAAPEAPGPELGAASPVPSRAPIGADAQPVGESAAQVDPAASVSARIVNAAGQPVAGATFRGSLYGHSLETESKGDGSVGLSSTLITREEEVEFVAVGPDQSAWVGRAVVAPGAHVLLGDLLLAPRATVSVRVRSGLLPVRNAVVVIARDEGEIDDAHARRYGPTGTELARGETGLFGKARVDGILPGRVRVWCRARGKAWAWTEPLELGAGDHREGISVTLVDARPAPGLTVRVVDGTGRAVGRCKVRAHSSRGSSSSSTTNDRGEARISFVDDRVERVVADAGSGTLGEAFADDLGEHPAEEPLVLALDAAELGTIAVVGAGGVPLENPTGSAYWAADDSWASNMREGEPGTLVARLSARPLRLRVVARHHVAQELGPFTRADFPRELRVTLASLPGLRGRVTAGGEPVAGAKLVLKERLASDALAIVNQVPSLYEPSGELRAESAADGSFRIDVRRSGTYTLFATAPGVGTASSGPLTIDGAVGHAGLALEIAPPGAIEGRVRRTDGLSPAGLIVVATAGDGEPRSRRTAADGSFRFEDVRAGDWYVYLGEHEPSSSRKSWSKSPVDKPWKHPFNCSVSAGETTVHDLVHEGDVRVTVTGSWTLNGAPESGWKVRLVRGRAEDPFHEPDRPRAKLDGDGGFALEVARPGHYELRVAPAAKGARLFTLTDRIEVGAGGFDWRADLATGALAGRVAADEGSLVYVWRDGTRRAKVLIEPEADGSFRLGAVPAGHGRIVRMPKGRHGDPWEWELVRAIELRARAENEVEL
ncbi:MAG: sigma-70 family RNA polymerase sigma factor [bacterium]|nr:sigma-70 family RNA polymerase sigma factor [bacterium]